jgi:hypothetical protein
MAVAGTAQSTLLKPATDKFWKSIGIYPPAAADFNRSAAGKTAARSSMAALGRGNLRMLCETAKLAHTPDQGDSHVAEVLLAATDVPTFLHLREFLKRKTEWIEQTYQDVFTERQRRAFAANVSQLGYSPSETIKPLTKLILIYRKQPKALLNAYVYEMWHKRTSAFVYAVDGEQATDLADIVSQNITRLRRRFEQVTRRGISKLVEHQLPSGLCVWVLLREYGSKVRRDYASQYQVINDCGLIVFGYDPNENVLQFRCGNKQLATALAEFFAADLSIDLRLIHNEVFSQYDPEQVKAAFLGAYTNKHGIEIVGVKFARTSLTGRGPLALEAGFMTQSIRRDLSLLSSPEHGLLDIRGVADIESLTLSFKGKRAAVTSHIQKGGAVRLAFDNAGWSAVDEREFQEAFLTTFGLPLNRQIDPSIVALGNVGLIAYLLSIGNVDDVEPYQQEAFDLLCDKGILHRTMHTVTGCQNNLCRERGKPVLDPNRRTCVACDESLERWNITGVARGEIEINALLQQVSERATSHSFDENVRRLEGMRYHALSPPDSTDDDQATCVLFADRPTLSVRHTFERASRPIVFVQPQTVGSPVYVDFDNVGHVSLAYLIASQEVPAEREACDRSIREMVDRLLLTHKERIEKAARHSYRVLTDQRDQLDGAKYEVELFNLIRVILPYSFRLGRLGKEEPDGFASIPDYRDIDRLEEAKAWHFTYDAKYSDKTNGYVFGAEERRQMLQYIGRFARTKQAIVGRNGQYQAHFIISNHLEDSKMASAAKFLRGAEGLKGKARQTRLIFMTEAFVLRLFEWVQSNATEAAQRRPHLYEAMIALLEREDGAGYVKLDEADVTNLIRSIRTLDVVELRVPKSEVTSTLDDEALLV